jgi:hypothetical protein
MRNDRAVRSAREIPEDILEMNARVPLDRYGDRRKASTYG